MTTEPPTSQPTKRKRSWKWIVYAALTVAFTVWTITSPSWWGVVGSIGAAYYAWYLFRGGRDKRTGWWI